MVRKIIHIDMDCFYASVEIQKNPSLQGKPVAIGGSPQKRGVLSTCNYEARKYGLHSAMPSSQAVKKCPQLILLPVNMDLYRQVSSQIHQIFYAYTDIVEPLSLDEAYLDVTNSHHCQGSATWIAEEIRQRIWEETGLTASAGVAPLKFLAKIASDYNKPNGMFVIKPHEVVNFVKNLPLSKIPGVGKVSSSKLEKLGFISCGDIQKSSLNFLMQNFGKLGQRIWQFSHGIDNRDIKPLRERKSVGVERTFSHDLTEITQGEYELYELFKILKPRLQKACPDIPFNQFHNFGVKLKFSDFHSTTLERSNRQLNLDNLYAMLQEIWQRRQGRSVRLIGIQVTLPITKDPSNFPYQLNLWKKDYF